MIWKTTNALGQEVTWYSEDEYHSLWSVLDDVSAILKLHQHGYGSLTHIERALNRIDEVENKRNRKDV